MKQREEWTGTNEAEELKSEVWEALGPHIRDTRDGLLDARNGLMRSMAVADEHELTKLHKEIGQRVMVLDDTLPLIDDLLAFVSPQLVVE